MGTSVGIGLQAATVRETGGGAEGAEGPEKSKARGCRRDRRRAPRPFPAPGGEGRVAAAYKLTHRAEALDQSDFSSTEMDTRAVLEGGGKQRFVSTTEVRYDREMETK